MEGREAEGMREVETVQDSRDMVLSARLLLIHAHKLCTIVGKSTFRSCSFDSSYEVQIARLSSSWKQKYDLIGQNVETRSPPSISTTAASDI